MSTEPTASAPTATVRVRLIGLGDELLAGAGDPRCLGWIGRAIASAQGSRSRADLFTAALPSETSAQLADRWERDVSDRLDAEGWADGSVDHRVVLGLGRADVRAGISLARSRLNLAKVLDGLERQRISAFVVGPPPSSDNALTAGVRELSGAFSDVCSRRRVPYVDTVAALADHDQWLEDMRSATDDTPGQTGYGLMAWLVLHGGFGAWAGLEEPASA